MSSLIPSYIFLVKLVKLILVLIWKRSEVNELDLNLRQAILANVSDNNKDDLEATIVDAIQSGEEKMLPGLGVLFELIWKQSNNSEKEEMLVSLEQSVKQAQ